jgi:hypothetical protein
MNHREYWANKLAIIVQHTIFGLTSICWWDITSRIEENWDIDVTNPAIGIATVEEIDDSSDNRLNRVVKRRDILPQWI